MEVWQSRWWPALTTTQIGLSSSAARAVISGGTVGSPRASCQVRCARRLSLCVQCSLSTQWRGAAGGGEGSGHWLVEGDAEAASISGGVGAVGLSGGKGVSGDVSVGSRRCCKLRLDAGGKRRSERATASEDAGFPRQRNIASSVREYGGCRPVEREGPFHEVAVACRCVAGRGHVSPALLGVWGSPSPQGAGGGVARRELVEQAKPGS